MTTTTASTPAPVCSLVQRRSGIARVVMRASAIEGRRPQHRLVHRRLEGDAAVELREDEHEADAREAEDEGALRGDLVAVGDPRDEHGGEDRDRHDERDVVQPHGIAAGEVREPLAGVRVDVRGEPVQAREHDAADQPEHQEARDGRAGGHEQRHEARAGLDPQHQPHGPAEEHAGRVQHAQPAHRDAGDRGGSAAVEHRARDHHRRAGQHRAGDVRVAEVAEHDGAQGGHEGQEGGRRDPGEAPHGDVDARDEHEQRAASGRPRSRARCRAARSARGPGRCSRAGSSSSCRSARGR